MPLNTRPDRDPLLWCTAITFAFLALLLWRITFPVEFYFDEIHYVPAARKLLDLVPANREHPMFGKEVIAGFIWLLGDTPLTWRLGPVLTGALGLFGFGRFLWHVSHKRRATILGMVLLATNFMWFVQSRIAMLDMIEAGLCMVGLWQFAAALRASSTRSARAHLLAAGLAMGLSLGAKWSSAPALMVPGLAFLALRLAEGGPFFWGRKGGAGTIPGISLLEAALWLGLFPLAIYWLTYLPAMFYADRPIWFTGFIEQHEYMIRLQDSVKKPHPYRSYWYMWATDWRDIWYLFKVIEGSQRGIVMLGNPLSMLTGLGALVWGLWAVLFRRRWDVALLLALYTLCLGVWAINGKPVQFYYHYLLPGAFLMGILAFALEPLLARRDRWRWLGVGIPALSVLLFLGFFPILSGLPLPTRQFYNVWMWLPSWR
ncbi:phospholipid carrier-dependent glycosyltransferase [Novosphingobium sp. MBES04]|uniref:phospholipid carrier-dependent glycosyltransferase n=1 Tax=Novosphingobium sp. MBES04 TaxID=1206458 RepID=UPI000580964E|nr:phospholipid carrier-dependent glycosyltransferase [Novosphingobium sp. MBES04]GAM07388.1 glycosyl transferase family protein [Novosphingobium sp. MBES04]